MGIGIANEEAVKIDHEGLYKEGVVKALENVGYIDEHGVADITKLRNFEGRPFNREVNSLTGSVPQEIKRRDLPQGSVNTLLWSSNFESVPGRDNSGEVIEKPLFPIINESESIYDVEFIKGLDFHLAPWELGRSKLTPDYPSPTGAEINTRELQVMLSVYHPKYGNGERDVDSGNLVVTYPDGRRRPISADFFKDLGVSGKPTLKVRDKNSGEESRIQLYDSPTKYIQFGCKELANRGLVTPDDFQSHELRGFDIGRRNVQKNGTVWVGGVIYQLPKEYGEQERQVYKLSRNHAVVLDQEGKPDSVFYLNRYTDDHISIDPYRKNTYDRIKRDGVPLESVADLRQNEPGVDLLLEQFEQFQKFAEHLARENSLDITQLSLYEQAGLTQLSLKFDWRLIGDLYTSSGLEGIQTAAILEESSGCAEALFEILTKDFNLGLEFINEMVLVRNGLTERVQEIDSPELSAWRNTVYEKASSYVIAASELLGIPDNDYTPQDMRYELKRFRRSGVKGYSAYQESIGRLRRREGSFRQVALEILAQTQDQQIAEDLRGLTRKRQENLEQTLDFYRNYEKLNKDAEKTTGSPEQLEIYSSFIESLVQTGKDDITVLSCGCGNGERIDIPTAEKFPQVRFKGKDVVDGFIPGPDNLNYEVGDFTDMPEVPESSFDAVTSLWSPVNDNLTVFQQRAFALEAFRVLKPGGEFFLECASLDGKGANWSQAAEEYQRRHNNPTDPEKAPPGTIESGNMFGEFGKKFYIFPKEEMEGHLLRAGFSNIQIEEYVNESGRARMLVRAKKN